MDLIHLQKELELIRCCKRFSLTTDEFKRFEELVLDKEVDPNCVDEDGRTPVLLLCRHNKTDKLHIYLKTLLKRYSVDLNYQDSDGWNALISACFFYHNPNLVHVVRLLLQRGMDRKAVTSKGSNALLAICCIYSSDIINVVEVITALLDGGIDIHLKGKNSWNALIGWCKRNLRGNYFLPVAELLINRGIDINSKDENEQNALFLVCNEHKNGLLMLKIIRLFIEKGIDVRHRDKENRDVLEILDKRPISFDSRIMDLIRSDMTHLI